MSRTFRNNGYGSEVSKVWKNTGDHGPRFFTTSPKKLLKGMTSGRNRMHERQMVHRSLVSDPDEIGFDSHRKQTSPWEIDWFRG